jgi:DNA helicase-2/ATP-dependent DNA helicase PcrA
VTSELLELGAPDCDDEVDDEIAACLSPDQPKSFFLYAGAGSGKTRSLKTALERFRGKYGSDFRRAGKKIAVITYTNAAADEIAQRAGSDPLFPISTIHSFCWAHIGTYHTDIQARLLASLPADLADLRLKQEKGRAGSKAALDRERGIAAIVKRLEWLSMPRRFAYNPNGDNFGMDSLSHSEVLKITAHFIETKPSMQAVLINKYPFLLIDESQDTAQVIINALFALEAANQGKFALGLFGDTMQRIYFDGRADLGRQIPAHWAHPAKRMNHRSPQRVIKLGNAIRAAVDGQRQMARDDSAIGVVRLFVARADSQDKQGIELRVRARMAELTGDAKWTGDRRDVKTLTLEHHMAAARGGFLPMFTALDKDSRLSTGLRKGELAGLRFFTERVAPLLTAAGAGDKFGVMALLRQYSPLLKQAWSLNSETADDPLLPARMAVEALIELKRENAQLRFLDVLKCIAAHQLFEIPDALRPFVEQDDATVAAGSNAEIEDEEPVESDAETSPSSLTAWRAFLETPFDQIIPFAEYVGEKGPFGTHQGVKGLEFDRVFVILDDNAARGFSFSYERLLGAKPPSADAQKKKEQGGESSIDGTRRLLYVTCTRTRRSLALIAYTEAPDALVESVLQKGWFFQDEVKRI